MYRTEFRKKLAAIVYSKVYYLCKNVGFDYMGLLRPQEKLSTSLTFQLGKK
jgi:hypothetical protein